VLAQGRRRLVDLAVDGEVDEVLELGLVEAAGDEAELQRGLLAALGEVALVEREAQLAVLEDEVLSGVVVAAAGRVHGERDPAGRRRPWGRRHPKGDPFQGGCPECDVAPKRAASALPGAADDDLPAQRAGPWAEVSTVRVVVRRGPAPQLRAGRRSATYRALWVAANRRRAGRGRRGAP
jgi:hypothetical protein